jgi:uncharacterized membrane protein YGL010W
MSKLEIDFKFYSDYHSHYLNKIIHIFCIPLICFSLFIFLNYIPYSIQFYDSNYTFLNVILCIKSSFILYISYILYYLYLSPFLGFSCGLFYLFILISSNLFYYYVNNAWIYSILFQISSWVIQILSHKFIEGNSPAFKDGLIQSFLTAPLFIVVEIIEFITNKKCIKRIDNNNNYVRISE